LKTEILDVTFGEKPENRKKPEKPGGNEKKLRKIGILLKSNHTYTSLMELNHVLAFTHEKLKRVCLKFDNVFKTPYV
jgi:hypothetical protein